MRGRAHTIIITVRVATAGAGLRLRPWVRNDAGRRLFVLPGDHRAWRLAMHKGALDEDAIDVWRRLVDLVRPDLVLDVGANYGEVALSCDYAPDATLHLFEPNPPIADRLERSVAESGLRAELHRVAVSDAAGTAVLHIEPRSSGLSSLDRSGPGGVEVGLVPLDDLGLRGDRVLFKIDTEGHEMAVLRGMTRLLADSGSWAGLVEIAPGTRLTAPYVYAVRRPELQFEHIEGSDVQRIAATRAEFTKDVVLSSRSLGT